MTEREFEKIIDGYTAYVVTVISKVAKERLNREDIEELASDVFAAASFCSGRLVPRALWPNAMTIRFFAIFGSSLV